ncbi:unnamed protein product [Mytilus coruscus]|uniref:Uncharacterized protein n=1 Tax=Mytilus coruscus TaxID=42192 RepID=A0A6J7ZYS5_MYTCO|nr:unnamed protein product [Mytilus coruscus]
MKYAFICQTEEHISINKTPETIHQTTLSTNNPLLRANHSTPDHPIHQQPTSTGKSQYTRPPYPPTTHFYGQLTVHQTTLSTNNPLLRANHSTPDHTIHQQPTSTGKSEYTRPPYPPTTHFYGQITVLQTTLSTNNPLLRANQSTPDHPIHQQPTSTGKSQYTRPPYPPTTHFYGQIEV